LTLQTAQKHLQAIRQHGETTYPYECCGLLLGNFQDNGEILLETFPMENRWGETATEVFEADAHATKERQYTIDPKVMLQVQKDARDRSLQIIGVYHSHPDHPAFPSEFDRKYAWPEFSYIIVSIRQGKATDLFSWRLDPQHQFQHEEIHILS
jgi:proteasome lid subunit RPN8/RPN11